MKRAILILSLVVAVSGCSTAIYSTDTPPDVLIVNYGDEPVQYEIKIRRGVGTVVLNESGTISAGREWSRERVLEPGHEYGVFVTINGTSSGREPYHHRDSNGLRITYSDGDIHVGSWHYD